jgi:hypothetical protein
MPIAIPITGLTAGTLVKATDTYPAVDTTDHTQAPSGTTKKYTMAQLQTFIGEVATSNKISVKMTSTSNLNATYSNGTAGVGATLVNAGAQTALVIDGVSAVVNDRVLVQGQTTKTQNGIYIVSNIGSGSTNWVLTRSTDYNTPAQINAGDIVGVYSGNIYADTLWMQNTPQTITIGTSNIVFEPLDFSPTLNYIYVDGVNGSDTTGTGSLFLPYQTIPHAMSNLPATFTKDDIAVIFLAPTKIYGDNFTLKANVFIASSSDTKVKLNGTININDASWSGQTGAGFSGCNITNANTFDFTAQAGNTQGELWFINCRITANQAFTMGGSNFVRIWNGEGVSTLTQSGGTLRTYNTSINAYTVNGSATTTTTAAYINGGNLGQDGSIGALTVNSTSGAASVFTTATVNYNATYSITGASAIVYASANAMPLKANITLASGGTLTKSSDGYGSLYNFTATGLSPSGNSVSDYLAAVDAELTLTNGQLLIGHTSNPPAQATLTAGTGITITNGAGSITIATTGGGFSWTDTTGSTQTIAVNSGYVSDDGASLVTFTLPATAALGDRFMIQGKGSGGWTIAQNANQAIHLGSSVTTTGAGGSLSSTNAFDAISCVCITAGASTIWSTSAVVGNITVV